jgi:glycosyltransferase involved in cell wall biosynthesis
VESRKPDEAWLLYIALSGAFPTPQQLDHFRNLVELSTVSTSMLAVLEGTLDSASARHVLERRMVIETDRVVVDANFCATEEHNTGIQRVVRETLPKWVAQKRPVRIVAWTSESTGMRQTDKYELDRVLQWNDRQFAVGHRHPREDDQFIETIVVPWRTDVFLPEVPLPSTMAPLACLAESSGNRVTLIGHDAIPLVSAEGQPNAESERFAHFLTVVKHAVKVVGVSRSAADEFRGFASAIPAQGLPGPAVESVSLAGEVPERARRIARTATNTRLPLILCVGSHEPRKNQEAVLFAAEYLRREGHNFRLVFVGRGSRAATHDFDARARRLRRRGMDVQSLRSLDDDALWQLYSEARFTAFVSLHEGFGLPVVESLALGTPVLTSNFGSLAEIAALGGCLTVDPRNDAEVIDGMRRMLEDDALISRLEAEAAAASTRTWDDYASELWSTAAFRTGAMA